MGCSSGNEIFVTSSAPEKQNENELDNRSTDRQTIYLYTCIGNLLSRKSSSTGGIETTSTLSSKVPIIKQGVSLLKFTL